MKPPSKNMSASLRGQNPPGRGPEPVSTGKLKAANPSMVIPGEGRTETAPGTMSRADGRQERNATVYANAAGRHVGGG